MVGDSLLVLIVYLVGLLAGIDQILYALFDGTGALSYFLNNLLVTGREPYQQFLWGRQQPYC